MKTILAVTCIVAFVAAEPPPSNSYLPPSSSNRGYPQSQTSQLPQVIAARALSQGRGNQNHHGAAANGLARNSVQPSGHAHGHAQVPQARFNDQQGYDHGSAGYDQNAALARNALGQANSEPANYNFGYMVNDYQEGTDFGHHEARQEERAQGEYHVVLPDGRKQTVSYEADESGFKPQISYEDTEDLTRSGGYDSNANFRTGYHGDSNNGGHSNVRSNGY